MPQQPRYPFTAQATRQGKVVQLMLSGYIWPDNSNASGAIAAELAALQPGDELEVLIRNLYGGDTDEGLTIYHDLAALKPRVKVDGVVASMGFVIMLAGSEVEVSSHSKAMMHRATGVAVGDYEDMRQRADQNEALQKELATLIGTKAGMTPDDVLAKLMPRGKDVWLTPKALVEMGLATRVTQGSLLRGTVAVKELRKEHDPERILERFAACLEEEVATKENDANQSDTMNKEIMKALGLAEGCTQEQYDSAVAESLRKGQDAVAKLDQIQKDQAAAQERELNELLEGAVKANSMTAATRDVLKEQAKNGNVAVVLASARAMVGELKPHQSAAQQLRGAAQQSAGGAAGEDRSGWDYKTWAQKDPKGLAKMPEADRAALKKAYVDQRKAGH